MLGRHDFNKFDFIRWPRFNLYIRQERKIDQRLPHVGGYAKIIYHHL